MIVTLFETTRLILRKYREEDLHDLYEYLSDPEVVRFEPYQSMSMDAVKETLARRIASDEMIAVELKETGKMIGNVYLGKRECETLEFGYVFNKNFWGKGYAFEACLALIDQVFADGIHRIYAECDPLNPGSWKLLERLGFTREAFLKKNVYFWKDSAGDPIWKDTYIYSKLAEDWPR